MFVRWFDSAKCCECYLLITKKSMRINYRRGKKRVHGENEEKRRHFRWFGWILTESHWNRLLRTHYMNMSNQYFYRFKCSHKLELKCGGVQIVQISNQNWIVSHGSLFAAEPNRAPFFSLQMWKKAWNECIFQITLTQPYDFCNFSDEFCCFYAAVGVVI